MLRIADEKIAELTKELNVAREEKDGAQMKIDSFRQQVLLNYCCVVSFFSVRNFLKIDQKLGEYLVKIKKNDFIMQFKEVVSRHTFDKK